MGPPDLFPHFQAGFKAPSLEDPCVFLLCRFSPHQSLNSHSSQCCSAAILACLSRFRFPHGIGKQRLRLTDSASATLEGRWDHNIALQTDHLTMCTSTRQPYHLLIGSPQSVSRPSHCCRCLSPARPMFRAEKANPCFQETKCSSLEKRLAEALCGEAGVMAQCMCLTLQQKAFLCLSLPASFQVTPRTCIVPLVRRNGWLSCQESSLPGSHPSWSSSLSPSRALIQQWVMQIPVLYNSSSGSSGIDVGVPWGWQASVCPILRGLPSFFLPNQAGG